MHQLMRLVGYTVGTLGIAYVVKRIKHSKEGSHGWHKIKVEEEKSSETVQSEVKSEGEKRTGTRYGSNPVRY